jgi:hypothetical protein
MSKFATITSPSIIKWSRLTLVFKFTLWVELIVTFEPEGGTTPFYQVAGKSQFVRGGIFVQDPKSI